MQLHSLSYSWLTSEKNPPPLKKAFNSLRHSLLKIVPYSTFSTVLSNLVENKTFQAMELPPLSLGNQFSSLSEIFFLLFMIIFPSLNFIPLVPHLIAEHALNSLGSAPPPSLRAQRGKRKREHKSHICGTRLHCRKGKRWTKWEGCGGKGQSKEFSQHAVRAEIF